MTFRFASAIATLALSLGALVGCADDPAASAGESEAAGAAEAVDSSQAPLVVPDLCIAACIKRLDRCNAQGTDPNLCRARFDACVESCSNPE
jgi:hypothetical protein